MISERVNTLTLLFDIEIYTPIIVALPLYLRDYLTVNNISILYIFLHDSTSLFFKKWSHYIYVITIIDMLYFIGSRQIWYINVLLYF